MANLEFHHTHQDFAALSSVNLKDFVGSRWDAREYFGWHKRNFKYNKELKNSEVKYKNYIFLI